MNSIDLTKKDLIVINDNISIKISKKEKVYIIDNMGITKIIIINVQTNKETRIII
ncbi:MAG: hypothetical protein GX641_01155 [Mollicutes bacterium]|nr:hypothetical protein [Mollicutes bacterium]